MVTYLFLRFLYLKLKLPVFPGWPGSPSAPGNPGNLDYHKILLGTGTNVKVVNIFQRKFVAVMNLIVLKICI